MKKITLLLNGEEKVFTVPFVSGLVLRKYLEILNKTYENHLEEMDAMAGLVVHAFKNQFTLEEFYEGTPQDKIAERVDYLFTPEDDNGEDKKK